MKITKAHRLWFAGAITLAALVSVTSVALQTNESASAVRTPSTSGVSGFSNLGINEFTRTLVKEVPVSATVLIQYEQLSSDGNGTITNTSGKIYRDSEGRTRYDEMRETKGQDESVVEELLKTTINDPAAGVSFILNPKSNTVRRKAFFAQTESGVSEVEKPPSGNPAVKQRSLNSQLLPVPNTMDMNQGLKPADTTAAAGAKRESLGRREIEGMLADGTRIVMTVPAGSMKNEKQIDIGCERWYSSSLKTLVLVECSDSRYGKTTYRLSQIKTDEPAASLFKVPADYKVYD